MTRVRLIQGETGGPRRAGHDPGVGRMSGPDLDPALRLEAHALLDRLVGEGATFSSGDARRLIALVPMTRASRFSFVGTLIGRGGRLRGDAAGVGPVDLDGGGRGTSACRGKRPSFTGSGAMR